MYRPCNVVTMYLHMGQDLSTEKIDSEGSRGRDVLVPGFGFGAGGTIAPKSEAKGGVLSDLSSPPILSGSLKPNFRGRDVPGPRGGDVLVPGSGVGAGAGDTITPKSEAKGGVSSDLSSPPILSGSLKPNFRGRDVPAPIRLSGLILLFCRRRNRRRGSSGR